MCGGNYLGAWQLHKSGGLSPRVRGKPQVLKIVCISMGSIPACAGETFGYSWRWGWQRVYPRVCGGNIVPSAKRLRQWGLSPRVRGKPLPYAGAYPVARSIPACAGETYASDP